MAEIGKDLTKAAELLKKGELVAIPTETVYGLAGNALDEEAVLKIFRVKNRPQFDPLIVHVAYLNQAYDLVGEIPSLAEELALRFWPGPLTLLLPKSNKIPDLVTSGSDKVAIRIPNHPLTLELLRKLPFPLAAPSANPFGYISPTRASHVNQQLGNKISYIIDGGECKVGLESTIIEVQEKQLTVYRWGGLSFEELEEVCPNIKVEINQSSNPQAPGMLKSHYAPKKPLLIGNIEELIKKHSTKEIGLIAFKTSYIGNTNEKILSPNGDLAEAARNLFAAMRELDEGSCEIILAEKFPDEFLGKAINDRLSRASLK